MGYALEFYSLSRDALKPALIERKPALIEKSQERQWGALIASDALGSD